MTVSRGFHWPREADDYLIELHKGGFSASEIAARITKAFRNELDLCGAKSVSRSAVLGRLKRLRDNGTIRPLPKKVKKTREAQARKLRQKQATPQPTPVKPTPRQEPKPKPQPKKPLPPVDAGPEPAPLNLRIEDLKRNQCRYPTSMVGGEHRFCGAPTAEGAVYCSHHHARCSGGLPPKPAKKNVPHRQFALPHFGKYA